MVASGIGHLKLHDVETGTGFHQFAVKRGAEDTQANTDPEVRLALQGLDQRQGDFADGNRVFARLDVNIRDAGGTMVDEEIGELLVFGAKTGEIAVTTAHTAIGTIFAAIVGNLDYSTDKNILAEATTGRGGSAMVKFLCASPRKCNSSAVGIPDSFIL